jgi:ParB-like chromosome segregation protein Spo0J
MSAPAEPDSDAWPDIGSAAAGVDPESPASTLLEKLGGQAAQPESWLAIHSLQCVYSPRLGGVDDKHVEALLETGDELPPILVQRSTMRVIDGMHRLSAARAAGSDKIRARLVDCDDEEALLLAVAANVRHGRPLTLADRRAAAARIMSLRPNAADRWIAALTGLAAKTVASIRREADAPSCAEPDARLGRDGRLRPRDAARGRERAAQLWLANPELSVRKVAEDAGISVGTAWDVRRKMRGDDTERKRAAARPAAAAAGSSALLDRLRDDPALRYTESGRSVLRWLAPPRILDVSDWEDIVDLIPPHAAYCAAHLARNCAQAWLSFARELERDGRTAQ